SPFTLDAPFRPMGDQPTAVAELTEGVFRGDRYHTLLGATCTGKTFSVSNPVPNTGTPPLVLSHSKTLAALLYAAFRASSPPIAQTTGKPTLVTSHNTPLAAQPYADFRPFFPHNAVEFFISYYDYYQPEAYIVSNDTYIEKDFAINEEIDRLRLRATSALIS